MNAMATEDAKQNISEAHTLLASLRDRLLKTEQRHPELEDAIQRLESALNALTVQTGGML